MYVCMYCLIVIIILFLLHNRYLSLIKQHWTGTEYEPLLLLLFYIYVCLCVLMLRWLVGLGVFFSVCVYIYISIYPTSYLYSL